MKRKRKYKKRTKIPHWGKLGVIIGISGIVVTFLAYFSSPRKADIKRIENLVSQHYSLEDKREIDLFPEGIPIEFEEKIDQLEEDIKKVESSLLFSLKSKTYVDISTFYFNYSDLKKSFDYVNKALKINPKNIKGLLLRAAINIYFGSFNDVKKDAHLVIQFASNNKINGKIVPIVYMLIAIASYFEGDINNAIKSINTSINSLSNFEYSAELLLMNYYLLKGLHMDLGNYDKSDFVYEKAYKLKESVKKLENKNEITYLILGLIEIEENPEIAKIYFDFLSGVNKKDDFIKIFQYFSHVVHSYEKNDLEESIQYIKKIKEISIKKELKLFEYLADLIHFDISLEKNDEINWNLVEKIKKNNVKIPLWESEMYITLGDYFEEKKEYEKSLILYNQALDILSDSGIKKGLALIYADIGLTEFSLKNYLNAYKAVKQALKEIDEILKLNPKGIKDKYISKKAKDDIYELIQMKINLSSISRNLESILSN